jgi:hypothetical protein
MWDGLAGRMDDLEPPFDHFPFFPGVDLTLWLQLLVVLGLSVAGVVLLVAAGG